MTGNEVAVDTNRAVAILNGDAAALAWARTFTALYLPVTVLAELRYGALNSAKTAHNQQRVDDLATRFPVLDVTASTASAYAELRLALKKVGRPIPQNDLWIAATCIDHKLPLATADGHFDNLPGLTTVR
ncbi:MAG TPA: type II toxin-antitoxin system VapC family toxin [Humisphaera sp.]